MATSSFANEERDGFYVKGEIGVNKIQKLEERTPSGCYDYNTKYLALKRVHFTENGYFISNPYFNTKYSVGGRYYINDFLRSDIQLNATNIDCKKANLNIADLSTANCTRDEIKVNMNVDNKLKRNTFVVSLLGNIFRFFNHSRN